MSPDKHFDRKRAEFEQIRDESALLLLKATCDAFYSLATDINLVLTQQLAEDPNLQITIDALDDANATTCTFLDSDGHLITVVPRSLRSDDHVRFLPSQHAGVALQYVQPDTGSIARINFYGGIRDPRHHQDMQDGDTTLRYSHTSRTDAVISQPTHLNLHMLTSSALQPFLDIWFSIKQTEIRLHTFIWEGRPYEILGSLPNKDRRFGVIYPDLNRAMNTLMKLVPNTYSPR